MLKNLVGSYSKKVHQPPGSLVHAGVPCEGAPGLSVISYNEAAHERHMARDFAEARTLMVRGAVSWLNVEGLHDTALMKEIGDAFAIHPLTLEDILHTDQRPKVEFFDSHIYFVLPMVRYDPERRELDVEQVSMILGSDFVVTFQERPGDVLDTLRERIEQGKGRIRRQGSDYLFYAILDVIIDHYFVSIEDVGEDIEELEVRALGTQSSAFVAELHAIRRELLFLRKAAWPLREQISQLMREEHPLISSDMSLYLHDLYDHTVQVADTVEILRDMLTGLLDVYLSSLSNRMNDVMRVLTIIATIFIPITFIAGVYGMNFEYIAYSGPSGPPIPEEREQ